MGFIKYSEGSVQTIVEPGKKKVTEEYLQDKLDEASDPQNIKKKASDDEETPPWVE
ncbi:MAG TPA: hypothetical protein VMX17_16890 [Candidatus Glassbacteria bacterium]|nr:hypothetical protein [Candidatus Glassbacteria bacterium]